jgi:hypothetical protein
MRSNKPSAIPPKPEVIPTVMVTIASISQLGFCCSLFDTWILSAKSGGRALWCIRTELGCSQLYNAHSGADLGARGDDLEDLAIGRRMGDKSSGGHQHVFQWHHPPHAVSHCAPNGPEIGLGTRAVGTWSFWNRPIR